MLAVVVADVEIDGDFHFERLKVGMTPADLRSLADWLVAHEVEEVVMESTAQYWRPVWEALEQDWRPRRRARDGAPRLAGTLHLAQAQSNRGPGGRKKDSPDAERLVKRLVAQELTLSFVPDVEQPAVARCDASQVPSHPQSRAAPESAGGPARGSAHQVSSLVSAARDDRYVLDHESLPRGNVEGARLKPSTQRRHDDACLERRRHCVLVLVFGLRERPACPHREDECERDGDGYELTL
jgi:hypothetical protein